jgi:hypothetical protein
MDRATWRRVTVDSTDVADQFQATQRPGTTARLDRGSYPTAGPPWVHGGLELGFERGKKGEGKIGRLQLLAQSDLGK